MNYFNLKTKGKERSIIKNLSKNITEMDFKTVNSNTQFENIIYLNIKIVK